ncbi:MAG: response regulator [Nitrososphaerales archaeon]
MKILVAEDEPDIAQIYDIALTRRKHYVQIAKDGEECLKIYRKAMDATELKTGNGSPFDAVVLDYRMPKKDGLQIAKEILVMSPNQRIIFASAYVKDTIAESVRELKRIVELLQKPFELSMIVDTIEDRATYEALEKLNMKMQRMKKPYSQKEMKELLEDLKKVQKPDIWYVIDDIIFA